MANLPTGMDPARSTCPSGRVRIEAYAHTPNDQGHWHDLEAHLRATAQQARAYAERFGAGEWAFYAGLCHDLGKFHPKFQQYLQACAKDQKARSQPHAWLGAHFVRTKAQLLAFIIDGHHAGMRDKSALKNRLESSLDAEAQHALREAQSRLPELAQTPALPAHLPSNDPLAWEMLTRMLFSCLVDADFLDTERHFDPERAAQRGQSPDLKTLWQRFEADQNALLCRAPDTPVNRARRAIYEASLAAASQPPGLFRLTAPTGGGKTRAVLGFALQHALRHELERVIVALPYTSIIDQTSRIYREILGADAVLEHHSALNWDDLDEDAWHRQKLLSENWDAPIIVTTFVQLFESLFGNKPSGCRKVHRLARSVMVLDEAQTLPIELLEPLMHGLQQLVQYFGATVVLCTATQPALERLPVVSAPYEIVPNPAQWFVALRRVDYQIEPQPLSKAAAVERIAAEPQVMVVLNARRDAVELVQAIRESFPEVEGVLHLSTLLCPAHRQAVLDEIHQRLSNGRPCRLIATQVVEAGVDLDFPLVMRALGPLDRIVQAAGRCNREGKLERGRVVIFELEDGRAPRGAYRTGIDEARITLRQPDADLHAPQTYIDYFTRLYQDVETDKHQIQAMRKDFQFESVARDFRLIHEDTRPLIVQRYEEDAVERLLGEARGYLANGRLPPRRWYQQIQRYAVSLYAHEVRLLEAQGLLQAEPELGLTLYTGEYDPLLGIVGQSDPADLVV